MYKVNLGRFGSFPSTTLLSWTADELSVHIRLHAVISGDETQAENMTFVRLHVFFYSCTTD